MAKNMQKKDMYLKKKLIGLIRTALNVPRMHTALYHCKAADSR